MPRGNESRKKPTGKGQPKRKNPSQGKKKPKNWNPVKTDAEWRQSAPQKQVGSAAAYATGQAGKGAKVMATRDRCSVQHREFIANVTGSTAFAIASAFAINPGIAATFPWLSSIANSWETYRFKRLRVCYYTRTGTNVPGSVIIAHDPDSSDAAPSTEQIMTTYDVVREDAPWKDICLVLKTLDLREGQARKFVRSGALAANEDIKLYDSGNVYIGTVDGTAVSWGKLWVEYDVEFQTPQLPPAGLPAAAVPGVVLDNSAGTGITPANMLGTAVVVTAAGLSATQALNVITLTGLVVNAEYYAVYSGTVTTTYTTPPTLTMSAGAANKTAISPGVITASGGTIGVTFTASATTATLTLGGNTVQNGPTTANLTVVQVPVYAR